jgi:hypothetical protein
MDSLLYHYCVCELHSFEVEERCDEDEMRKIDEMIEDRKVDMCVSWIAAMLELF